ncbi:MAG: 1-acyl-sn-glycerol-3-phosphate acyltransferase [Phocaeicola sp.]|nr:1-acyl-sn-glycerol-3-phosphate acyltransferase [Phocaeicola sp.]
MNIPAEFDHIRPYTPEELPQVYEELIADPAFQQVATTILPYPFEMIAAQMRQCRTNLQFEKTFFYDFIKNLLSKNSSGMTQDFSKVPDKTKNYLFISNHRDIVMDPALLSVAIIDAGWENTTEIAIGDNLLAYPWIKRLVRILKAFIVLRGLTGRQQLEVLTTMSRYIHFAVAEKHENVWIAQRQGRAKDSNDRTQESILKMLTIGGEGSYVDRLKELNIVPLSLSYEYDPCDYLKARELQQRRDQAHFHKAEGEDVNSMKTGILGFKGKIHFQAAPCINAEIDRLAELYPKKTDFYPALTRLMDEQIFSNYRIYPNNYVALDWLQGQERYADHYTPEDKERFTGYIHQQMSKIELPEKDEAFLLTQLLRMYANPLINYLSTQP